jgi:hypothetical protein
MSGIFGTDVFSPKEILHALSLLVRMTAWIKLIRRSFIEKVVIITFPTSPLLLLLITLLLAECLA